MPVMPPTVTEPPEPEPKYTPRQATKPDRQDEPEDKKAVPTPPPQDRAEEKEEEKVVMPPTQEGPPPQKKAEEPEEERAVPTPPPRGELEEEKAQRVSPMGRREPQAKYEPRSRKSVQFRRGDISREGFRDIKQRGGTDLSWMEYSAYKKLKNQGLGALTEHEVNTLKLAGIGSRDIYSKWEKAKEILPAKKSGLLEERPGEVIKKIGGVQGKVPPMQKTEEGMLLHPTKPIGQYSPREFEKVQDIFNVPQPQYQKAKALEEGKEAGIFEETEEGEFRLTKTPSEMSMREEEIAERAGIEMPGKGPSRRLYEWGEKTFEEGSWQSELTESLASSTGAIFTPPRNIARVIPFEIPGEDVQTFTWRTAPDVEPMTERQEASLMTSGLATEFGVSALIGKGIGELAGTGVGFVSEATGLTGKVQPVLQSGYSTFQTGKAVAPTATKALGLLTSRPAIGAMTTSLLGGYQTYQVGKMREPVKPKYMEKEEWRQLSEEEKAERGVRASWPQVGSYLAQTGGTMLGFASGFPSGVQRGISWGQKFRLGRGPVIPEEEFVPKYVRSGEMEGQFPSFRGESALRGRYIRPSAQSYTQLARKYSPQVLRILPEERAVTPSWSGQVAQKFGTKVLSQRSGITFRPNMLWTKPSFSTTGGATGKFITPLGRHGTGMHFSFGGSKYFLRLGGESSYMPGFTNPFRSPRWIYTELAIPEEVAASKTSPQFQQFMQQTAPGKYRFAMPMQSQWGEAQAVLSPETTMVEVSGPQFWAAHGGKQVPIMRFLPKEIAEQASNVTAISGTETTLGSLSASQVGSGYGRTYLPLTPTPSVEEPSVIKKYPSVTETVLSESTLTDIRRPRISRGRKPPERPSQVFRGESTTSSLIGGYTQPSYGGASYEPVVSGQPSVEISQPSYGFGEVAPTQLYERETVPQPSITIPQIKKEFEEKRKRKKQKLETFEVYRERFFPIESPVSSSLIKRLGERESSVFERPREKKKSKKKKKKKRPLSISNLLNGDDEESITEEIFGEKKEKKTKKEKNKNSKNSIFGGKSLTEEVL